MTDMMYNAEAFRLEHPNLALHHLTTCMSACKLFFLFFFVVFFVVASNRGRTQSATM